MEIPRDAHAIYDPRLRQRAPLPSNPIDSFVADYKELIASPVTFLIPNKGIREWHPTRKWVDERCHILKQLFEKGDTPDIVYDAKVRGGFSEIVAPIIIDTIVRQATDNEFICIPALPQLDMEGPRFVRDPDRPGMWVADKSADIIVGRVVQHGGRVLGVEPVMFFDIKAGARENQENARVGVGYNERLGAAIPVGIFYAGDLRFEDKTGQRRTAKDHFLEVVDPMVRRGRVTWQVTWPGENGIPKHDLAHSVVDELGKACYFTARTIQGKGQMPNKLKDALLGNIDVMQRMLGVEVQKPLAGQRDRRSAMAS